MGTIRILSELWAGLGGAAEEVARVRETGAGALASVFAVTDLAAASIGAAGLATSALLSVAHGGEAPVVVDRRLASFWFASSLRPEGWAVPPPWDPIAGDYRAGDRWIRLHTNAPAHRAAALAVLGVAAEREAVAGAVAHWEAAALEGAIVAAGGCAAAILSIEEWRAQAQGAAVAGEPIFHWQPTEAEGPPTWAIPPERPLQGVRVLDLTRVLAGPIATRFLAGLGAEVLRIDPPWWEEPGVVPEVTLGKRCARLDLRDAADRATLEGLLAGADVLVHGYRPEALDRLGLGAERRQALRPGLIDVSLDAYGWTGPWAGRRGFDSLVQMSAGIAEAGMLGFGRERPTPLPVQALDHATGYLLAAAVLRGMAARLRDGAGLRARTSLARTAEILTRYRADDQAALEPEQPADLDGPVEKTSWGKARRLRSPVTIGGLPLRWDRPASALGSALPDWAC